MSAWLLKLAAGNPLALLWVAGAIALAAGGVGWQLNGWRLGAEVAEVEVKLANATARSAVRAPANAKCAADVKDVRQAFADWQVAEAKRTAAVKAAIAKAGLVATANLETARLIMTAPRPAVGQECAGIVNEEAAYVQSRQKR